MERKSLCADDLNVIDRCSDMVYRMAYSMLKNKYDAEDVHQEVFIKYLRKRPTFESTEHERAWFLRVTINLCKNFWKTAWRQKTVSFREIDMERAEEAKVDEIVDIVKQLPQKYRLVIHLFYYEELSINEISELLNMKASTVRTQLTRARDKLKELWKEG